MLVETDTSSMFIGWVIPTTCERYLPSKKSPRSEIAEAGEGFDVKKQVGSSTMAHKKNRLKSENASGLARIVRSFITPSTKMQFSSTKEI